MPREQLGEAEQLRLFEGGPDMAKLRALAKSYTHSARAANTVIAYAADWAVFQRWCRSVGRKPLPAAEDTVLLFVAAELERHKVSTVERRLAAIMDAHRSAELVPPSGGLLRDVMRGARRQKGAAPVQKAALRPEDLRAVCVKLQRVHKSAAVRDRAMMCVGFAAALRCSEVRGLDVGDLQFVRKGVVVSIRKSKTDQESRGRKVGVFAGKRASTCPVRALKAWLFVRGREAGPLFPGRKEGARITTRAVNNIVKRSIALAGLDPAKYGSHSLRAGCVTAAAEAGVPDSLIMQRTGHRSVQTVAGYVRPASLFSFDVLARAM